MPPNNDSRQARVVPSGHALGESLGAEMRQLTWCLVYFVVFGPMVGFISSFALVGMLEIDISSISSITKAALGVFFAAVVGVPLLPGAVLVGGFPALLAGGIYWLWRRRLRLSIWQSVAISGVTGGGVCAITGIAVDGSLSDLTDVELWRVFILPGGIAGALTAWLVECRVWSRSSRSHSDLDA